MNKIESGLKKLIMHCGQNNEFPIEIEQIKQWIIKENYQEKILFYKTDLDTNILKGSISRYINSKPYDTDPERVSIIQYSKKLSNCWARLVCCKEMMHIFDSRECNTFTLEEINNLTFKLCTPLSGNSDKAVIADHIAVIPALMALAPIKIIDQLKESYKNEIKTDYDIASFFRIPQFWVPFIMSDQYKDLAESI